MTGSWGQTAAGDYNSSCGFMYAEVCSTSTYVLEGLEVDILARGEGRKVSENGRKQERDMERTSLYFHTQPSKDNQPAP